MSKERTRSHRLRVVACTEKPGCYRWIVDGPGGERSERSSYAFATAAGAHASGRCWCRVFEAGRSMA